MIDKVNHRITAGFMCLSSNVEDKTEVTCRIVGSSNGFNDISSDFEETHTVPGDLTNGAVNTCCDISNDLSYSVKCC